MALYRIEARWWNKDLGLYARSKQETRWRVKALLITLWYAIYYGIAWFYEIEDLEIEVEKQ